MEAEGATGKFKALEDRIESLKREELAFSPSHSVHIFAPYVLLALFFGIIYIVKQWKGNEKKPPSELPQINHQDFKVTVQT